MKTSGFKCLNCKEFVADKKFIGTAHRNHCPICLWSKHIMNSDCGGKMEPIGLTFKKEGLDKYGKEKIGELMMIHLCLTCHRLSFNRIAADDNPEMILHIFEESKNLNHGLLDKLNNENIKILTESDKPEILIQLYGNT